MPKPIKYKECADLTSEIETCFTHVDRLRELKAENPQDYLVAVQYIRQVALGEIVSDYLRLTAEMAESILWELDEGGPLVAEISRQCFEDLLAGKVPQDEPIEGPEREDEYMGDEDRFISLEEATSEDGLGDSLEGYLPDED